MNQDTQVPRAGFGRLIGYGLGECANSLIMNGFFGFAMLYYTEALKLSPVLAGLAMSLSVFWEAITDPVMGHLSDHTRHRFGRRHPWMLFGGLLMALCFYFIWDVPAPLRGNHTVLFGYLVVMNLLLRTGLTMFFIPYVALGFELRSDYDGRAKLQAVRQVLNMAANFAGPAMAWSIFFRDTTGPDGVKCLGTTVPANFVHMGLAFSLATVLMVLLVLWFTRAWALDSRNAPLNAEESGVRGFWRDMKGIVTDVNPRWVFVFTFIICVAMVLVSSLQMYVYVYFMKFASYEKSIAHGSTMVGMAIGGALSAWVSTRFDKKGAVILGGVISIIANAVLGLVFLTGFLAVDVRPAGLIVFVLFHACYWLGNGIMLPVATAMVADVGAVNFAKTGVNRDGSYSAVFSLAMRLAISFALMGAGWILQGIGFVTDAAHTTQTPEAIWRLGVATFAAGSLVSFAALLAIARYPLSRARVEELTGKQLSEFGRPS